MRQAWLAVLTWIPSCLPAAAAATSLPASLAGLDGQDTVTVKVVGKSVQGKPIHLVIAADPGTLARQAPAVLILCGQHGDEPVAARAVFRVLRHIASSRDATIRERIVTLAVPWVNPDGLAAGQRSNASGTDLNRDWRERTQPETRALFDVYLRWKPALIIDAHEWSPGDSHRHNAVEIPLFSKGETRPEWAGALNGWVSEALGGCVRQGVYVQRLYWSTAHDKRLAHRYFTSAWGTPAILYETMPSGAAPFETRMSNATVFLLAILRAVALSAPAPLAPPSHATVAPMPWPLYLAIASGIFLLLVSTLSTPRVDSSRPARGLRHALVSGPRVRTDSQRARCRQSVGRTRPHPTVKRPAHFEEQVPTCTQQAPQRRGRHAAVSLAPVRPSAAVFQKDLDAARAIPSGRS